MPHYKVPQFSSFHHENVLSSQLLLFFGLFSTNGGSNGSRAENTTKSGNSRFSQHHTVSALLRDFQRHSVASSASALAPLTTRQASESHARLLEADTGDEFSETTFLKRLSF